MSSRGTSITINGIHPSAVYGAVKKMEKYRDQILAEKINKTLGDVAKRYTEVASNAFGAGVGFSTQKVGQFDYEVTAFSLPGTQLISFLEFGTGFYADASHKYVSMVDYNVYPGSWSETHAKTWEAWLQAGKDPAKYPYNKQPRRGVLKGMEAAREYVNNMSKRAR